jgi:hypothetical protein
LGGSNCTIAGTDGIIEQPKPLIATSTSIPYIWSRFMRFLSEFSHGSPNRGHENSPSLRLRSIGDGVSPAPFLHGLYDRFGLRCPCFLNLSPAELLNSPEPTEPHSEERQNDQKAL